MATDDFRISRAFPRYELDARVDYVGSEVLLGHHIANISLGGLCIHTASVEDIGTEVDLVINFPDLKTKLHCKGIVVWSNREPPSDMGIRFTALDPVQRDILRRYLQSHDAQRAAAKSG